MAQFVNAAPKLKRPTSATSYETDEDTRPPPRVVDTWSLEWRNRYKPKLHQFDHFYDDGGKEVSAGALSADSGFQKLCTDAAKRNLVAEVKCRKTQGSVKFEKQTFYDVSSNNFLYLPDSDVVAVGEDAIQTAIAKLEYAAR